MSEEPPVEDLPDNVTEIRSHPCCPVIHPDSNQQCHLPPDHRYHPHCVRRLPDVVYTLDIPAGTRPEDQRFVHWRAVGETAGAPASTTVAVAWQGERVRDPESNLPNPFVPGAGGVLRNESDET